MERCLYSYRIDFDNVSQLLRIEQEDSCGNGADVILMHKDQLEMFFKDINDEIKG